MKNDLILRKNTVINLPSISINEKSRSFKIRSVVCYLYSQAYKARGGHKGPMLIGNQDK